jgi:hypothetical protein
MNRLQIFQRPNITDPDLIRPASTQLAIEKLAYKMNEIIDYLNKNDRSAAYLGKKGGDKTAQKKGPEFYKKIGQVGAAKRWGYKLKEEV